MISEFNYDEVTNGQKWATLYSTKWEFEETYNKLSKRIVKG